MLYLISYDLTKKPESEYEALFGQLEQWGGVRILYSEWLVSLDASAREVLDAVLAHVLGNDLVWVLEVTTNSAWRGCRGGEKNNAKALAMFAQARD